MKGSLVFSCSMSRPKSYFQDCRFRGRNLLNIFKRFSLFWRNKSYSTSCVIDVHTCKDMCGRKCQNLCKNQHPDCDRGVLNSLFLYCQFSPDVPGGNTNLPFTTYEIIEETNVKEGKKTYKRYCFREKNTVFNSFLSGLIR